MLPIVVRRRPNLARPLVHEVRGFIRDPGGGSEPILQGGRVQKGLDGRPGLTQGLDGPVELARAEGQPADHGLDLAGLGLDGQEGALERGLLVEGALEQGLVVLVQGSDLDLDEVARLQDLVQGFDLRPGDALVRDPAGVLFHLDHGLILSRGENDGLGDLADLGGGRRPALQPDLLRLGPALGQHVPLDRPPAQLLVDDPQPGADRLLGIFLIGGVQGRIDLQALAIEGVAAVGLFDVFPDFLEIVGAEVR